MFSYLIFILFGCKKWAHSSLYKPSSFGPPKSIIFQVKLIATENVVFSLNKMEREAPASRRKEKRGKQKF